MSEATASGDRTLVLCKPDAVERGLVGEIVDVIDDVREAVTFAIGVTPADGQVVITGSLYVVSPARSVLVD